MRSGWRNGLNRSCARFRAPTAPRGAAVVRGEAAWVSGVGAGEVNTRATEAAQGTGVIAAQISAMRDPTGQATAALQSIGGTIERMNEIAVAIAGAVGEQGAATKE